MGTAFWIVIALVSITSISLVVLTLLRVLGNVARVRSAAGRPGKSTLELWDLFDRDRQPLNRTHDRQEPLPEGCFHVVVQIWAINSRQELLLTRRHPDKPYGGFWECPGGSVLAGESSRSGAVRELREETGIIACASELRLLGTVCEKTSFVDSYAVYKDIAQEKLVLQAGETTDAQWATLEQLDRMTAEGQMANPVTRRLVILRPVLEDCLRGPAGCPAQPETPL